MASVGDVAPSPGNQVSPLPDVDSGIHIMDGARPLCVQQTNHFNESVTVHIQCGPSALATLTCRRLQASGTAPRPVAMFRYDLEPMAMPVAGMHCDSS